MAGLQTAGVELVVKNFSGFIAAMGRVNSTVQKFGSDSAKMAQQVQTAQDRVTRAQNAQANSIGNLEKARIRQTQAERAYQNQLAKITATIASGKTVSNKAAEQLLRYAENAQIAGINVDQMQRHVDDATLALGRQTSKFQELSQAMQLGQQIGSGAGGVSGIAGSIGVAGSSLTGVGVAIAAVTAGLAVLAAGAIAAFNGVKNLTVAIATGLVNAFKILWGVMQPVISGFLKIISLPITRTFQFLSTSLKEVTADFANTLAEFQRFGIMFEALIARDTASQFKSMSEALTAAVLPAKQLFGWVKQLAVTTPFTAKGITEVLAMANAMGLTTDQAKDLTVAVGNFTAGMGLTEEHMWRIIYNFGQMLAQGKVTGREFRDLAISFVPVWKMLDEMAAKAGMATEEFKKLALEGKVPVPAFFKEFIDMAARDFPNAMERMARTWTGVIGNAKDFIQVVVGMNIFGKSFNQITAAMADSLQNLIKYLTPLTTMLGTNLFFGLNVARDGFIAATDAMDRFRSSIVKILGLPSISESMGWAGGIAKISVLIREIGNQIAKFIDWINRSVSGGLKNVAGNAKVWGYNIVAMIAQGMAAGIGLIAKVINYIAKVIAYWLSPGSPPKALPKLPQWGMEAMAEYLRGFTEADFDALEGIQKPLEEALDILVDTGRLGERAAANLYRDLSMAIAEAISSGNIEESLFERIARAAGPFGREIAKLARLQIQLAQATNALVAAEKALEEAQKRENAARVSVNKKVKEYNAMLRAGADKTALAAKLAEVQASEQAARAATEERVRQEQLVEAAKAQVEALKEAVSLQERLVQQLLEITRKQIIQVDADTSGAAGALEDLLENFDWGLGGAIENAIDERGQAVQEALDWGMERNWLSAMRDAETWLDDIKKEMKTLFKPAEDSLKDLEKAFGGLMDLFGGNKAGGLTPMLAGLAQPTKLDILVDDLNKTADAFMGIWDAVGLLAASLSGLNGEPLTAAQFLLKILRDFVALPIILTINGVALAILNFRGQVEFAKDAWRQFYEGLHLEELGKLFSDAFNGIVDWIKEQFGSGKGDGKIMIAMSGFITNLGAKFAEFIPIAIQWGVDVYNAIVDALYRWMTKMNVEWGNIKYWAMYHWNKIKDVIKEKIEKARDLVRDAMGKIQQFIDNIKTAFLESAVGRLITKLGQLIEKIKEGLRALGINVPGTSASDQARGNTKFGGDVKPLSPTVVGEHGWEVFVPYAKGMVLNQRQISDIIQVAASQVYGGTMPYLRNLVASPMQPSPVVAQSKQVNINFGGVVIANGMDMAVFEANVRNIVRQEFA